MYTMISFSAVHGKEINMVNIIIAMTIIIITTCILCIIQLYK